MDKFFAETQEAYLAVLRADGQLWANHSVHTMRISPFRKALSQIMYTTYAPQMIWRTY